MALVVLLSLVAAYVAPLRAAVLVLDALLAALVILDVARTPDPARLDVRRRVPARAAQGRDLVRTLRVDAGGVPAAAGLVLEVDEEFPPSFEVAARTRLVPGEPPDARIGAVPVERPGTVAPAAGDPGGGPDAAVLPAAGPIDLARVYVPRLRGMHELGDLRLRLRGRLGLVERSARVAGRHATAVEPALPGLRRNLLLAASERWRDLGSRASRWRGGLQEFDTLRDHVPGDEVRLVDWKAFARRGRPIVRQYREERGQELVVAIDCGRRMGATTSEDVPRGRGRPAVARGMTKLDHALDAGLQLAAVALEHGDRVGVLAFDADVIAWIPPARGRAQLARLRGRLFGLEASARESDLERALRELALRHRRRALVLVLSDVADPLSVERQAAALRAGSGRHRVIFAGLDDPALRALAEGRIEADPLLAASAAALVAERRAGLRRLASRTVRVLDAPPAEASAPAIAAWLAARRSG